jgi:hypothetical protein
MNSRFDCRQVVIDSIVTPERFPLSYEVLAGDTGDSTTLRDFSGASTRAMVEPTAFGSWTAVC